MPLQFDDILTVKTRRHRKYAKDSHESKGDILSQINGVTVKASSPVSQLKATSRPNPPYISEKIKWT